MSATYDETIHPLDHPAPLVIPVLLTGGMAGVLIGLIVTVLTILLNEAGPLSWMVPLVYMLLLAGTGALAASFAVPKGARLSGWAALGTGILAGAVSGFLSGFILAVIVVFFFPEIGIAPGTAAAAPIYKVGASGLCGCAALLPAIMMGGLGGWLYGLLFKPR